MAGSLYWAESERRRWWWWRRPMSMAIAHVFSLPYQSYATAMLITPYDMRIYLLHFSSIVTALIIIVTNIGPSGFWWKFTFTWYTSLQFVWQFKCYSRINGLHKSNLSHWMDLQKYKVMSNVAILKGYCQIIERYRGNNNAKKVLNSLWEITLKLIRYKRICKLEQSECQIYRPHIRESK